ncbi:Sugar transferase involved in LPS biosynthesis (colanic, teichoic acid) [Ruminococcus sp. YE71]|uniref:sugar transferase n=1 Tax=unclassified Ruminococcus TaxID=2608920 RepID=UPI00087F2C03|nr:MULTISPECIES: sugar transferase [unclassified Ruminococcus]SDA13555.1 Sugar transferase involved in LPS biosynthesis (colanic, teichoic acid) [Ruminococcus sp. YE78]SFW19292.1 Sugar transferase involved in LPS biosynthesis (colanic, teichoic acid) [Ruminococcus sp. YE71]
MPQTAIRRLPETEQRAEILMTRAKKHDDTVPPLDFVYEEKPLYEGAKRLFDIILSLTALILLSPVIMITAAMIMIRDPGNPFFSQDRVGKNGKHFRIYKMRSMYKNAESAKAALMARNESEGCNFKIRQDPRVLGKLGKFIRSSSIDELPQLLNILKGEMSFIGPRPFIPREQEQLTADRLLVKPGLSCYWQVNGKNSLSTEMSEYCDRKYIMDRSIITDLGIVMKTLYIVMNNRNT